MDRLNQIQISSLLCWKWKLFCLCKDSKCSRQYLTLVHLWKHIWIPRVTSKILKNPFSSPLITKSISALNKTSHVCFLWWIVSPSDREKDLSHEGQAKGFSPVCVLIWIKSFWDWEKSLSHWVHEYCFSPVWFFIWVLRFPPVEKAFSHWGHE